VVFAINSREMNRWMKLGISPKNLLIYG
jgi:hypothetical protein